MDKDTRRKIKDNQRKKYARKLKRRAEKDAAEALSATLPQKFNHVFAAMNTDGIQHVAAPLAALLAAPLAAPLAGPLVGPLAGPLAAPLAGGIGSAALPPNVGDVFPADWLVHLNSLPNTLRAQHVQRMPPQQPQQIPLVPPAMAAGTTSTEHALMRVDSGEFKSSLWERMGTLTDEWRARGSTGVTANEWAIMSDDDKVAAMVKETETARATERGDSGKGKASGRPSLEECIDVFADDWASASASDRSESNTEAGGSGRR